MAEVKFFSARREIKIGDFVSLKSAESERRVKAHISIPMSNRSNAGCPDWVLDGYQFVVKDDAPFNKTTCKKMKFEGMSLTFYTSDTIKKKMNAGMEGKVSGLHACTMEKFQVERVGEADKAEVYLHMELRVPSSEAIILWFYSMQGASIFAEFDSTQATFSYSGEKDDPENTQESLPLDDVTVIDPNDDPDAPIVGDTREVIEHGGTPQKRSHKKKSK